MDAEAISVLLDALMLKGGAQITARVSKATILYVLYGRDHADVQMRINAPKIIAQEMNVTPWGHLRNVGTK